MQSLYAVVARTHVRLQYRPDEARGLIAHSRDTIFASRKSDFCISALVSTGRFVLVNNARYYLHRSPRRAYNRNDLLHFRPLSPFDERQFEFRSVIREFLFSVLPLIGRCLPSCPSCTEFILAVVIVVICCTIVSRPASRTAT